MTLFILAAGMGSRYGGLKQIDSFTDNGEFIIDFSIYDAIRAGFDRVVFVIKKENFEIFRETVGKRIEGKIKVEYVFQGLDSLVSPEQIPAGRVKPWGTTHALLCGKEVLNDGFAVINADDFYGRDAFVKAAEFIRSAETNSSHYCMVGYMLGNTLTDNGSVARGESYGDENGYLYKIAERTKLFKEEGGAYYTDDNGEIVHLPNETVVSMNFWGFTPKVFEGLEEDFSQFIRNNPSAPDPLKSESLLPNTIGKMIQNGQCDVKILTTTAKWFGVTYADDKPDVIAKIHALIEAGEYPKKGLWNN